MGVLWGAVGMVFWTSNKVKIEAENWLKWMKVLLVGDYRVGCKVKHGGENAPTILKRT